MVTSWRTLFLAVGLAVGALSALALTLVFRSSANGFSPGPGWQAIGSYQDLEGEGTIRVPGDPFVYVTFSPGAEPIALAAAANHAPGEALTYCSSSKEFEGMHGEKYDSYGNYVTGPGNHDMNRVALVVVDNQVYLNPEMVTPGPPRDSYPAAPPAGPFCNAAG